MTNRTITRVAAALVVAAVAVTTATVATAQAPQPFVVVPPAPPAPAAAPAAPAPPTAAPFVFEPGSWDFDFDFDIQVPEIADIYVPDVNVDLLVPDFQRISAIADGFAYAFAQQPPRPPQPPQPAPQPLVIGPWKGGNQTPERLYRQGRQLIENDQYERAVEALTAVANEQSELRDAASYWRAYSLHKLGRTADALAALRDFQQQFKQSRWLNDARALEAEVKQSSGQPISADAAATDDIKVMAARGLIQSDPDRAIPVLERLLSGVSSPRVKEQTLFVLSQSNAPRAREIIINAAKGSHNPEVQVQAIRHIGMMGATQTRLLSDIYRGTTDKDAKRAVIRGLGSARARAELLGLARTEEDAELRGDAIRQLRGMQANEELQELFRSEKSPEVRRRIIESFGDPKYADWVADVARRETDPDVKRAAIRSLAQTRSPGATDVLVGIYTSDSNADVRRAVLEALQMANNGRALVDLARKETDATRKREIVQRLSMMRGQPEVTEYLLELLK